MNQENSKHTNKRVMQGYETKRKLYDTATQLFRQYGFEQVSIADITKATGVTKGTFYVHFPSKDALIASLIQGHTQQIDIEYREFIKALPPTMSTKDVILSLCTKIAQIMKSSIGKEPISKLYQLMLMKDADVQVIIGPNRELSAILHQILTTGAHNGEFPNHVSIEDTIQHLIIGMRGCIFEWCAQYPNIDLETLIAKQTNLILQGSMQ